MEEMRIMAKNTFEGKVISGTDASRDSAFKDMFKYPGMAAELVRGCVKELSGYSVEEVASFIVRGKDNGEKFDAKDLFNSEIERKSEYNGELGEKQIIYDMVFDMVVPKENGETETIEVKLAIDLEMQRNMHPVDSKAAVKSEYSLVSRGIYYAASLLRDTITRVGAYSSMHKVISIWICNGVLMAGPGSSEAIHKYRILRTYDEIPYDGTLLKNGSYRDPDGDLLEVIFIELGKLEDVRDDTFKEFLDSTFFKRAELGGTLKKLTGQDISDTEFNEEVNNVYSKEDIAKFSRAEGLSEAVVAITQSHIKSGMVAMSAFETALATIGHTGDRYVEVLAARVLLEQGIDVGVEE